MICFHFTIFVVLETTVKCITSSVSTLWFAFILLSLSYWKQPDFEEPMIVERCDLLSFYYLCRTGNNSNPLVRGIPRVVICFHFTIFVVLETTVPSAFSNNVKLWFAFILLSLSYWKQLIVNSLMFCVSCDLLSFYYLCRTGNNPLTANPFARVVVICFHFTIFVVLETTLAAIYWPSTRCDLLSFYYLCRTGNNAE